MMDLKDYRRLPGRVAGPLYSARLYQGPDHLLKTTVQAFHEHLRRFAWEDIQAFIVEETPWRGVTNLLLALVFTMQAISFITFTDKTPGILMIYLPFLVVIAVLMLVNHRRGPTCKTFVQTAVTRERLWSLNRARKAREVVDMLAPLILEKQAAAEAMREASGEPEAATGTARMAEKPVGTPAGYPGADPRKVESGSWHWIACLLMAFFVGDSMVDLLTNRDNAVMDEIGLMVFAISCGVCIAALISQERKLAPRSVRTFGWTLLAYHIFSAMLIFGVMLGMFLFTLRHPEFAKSGFKIRNMAWYNPMVMSDLALEMLVLFFGLRTMMRYSRGLSRGTGAVDGGAGPAGPAALAETV